MEQNVPSPNPTKTSGMAILSLIFSFIPFLGIVAVILGVIAGANIKKRKQELSGQGLVIAGLVIGTLNFITTWFLLPYFLSSQGTQINNETATLQNIPQIQTEPTTQPSSPVPIRKEFNASLAAKIIPMVQTTIKSPESKPEVMADNQGVVTIACWYKHIKPGRADDELLTIAVLAGDFADLSQKIFKLPEVNYFRYLVCEKLVDEYGVTKDYWICKIGLSRKTAQKINWENPLLVDFTKIADEYELGCEVYEGITKISAPPVSRTNPPPTPIQAGSGEKGNQIKTFSGSGDMTTETFYVPTDTWKATVFVKSDNPEYTHTHVYAYADGKNPEKDVSDGDFSKAGIGPQSSYFRTGKGNYFLRVSSSNGNWTVVVESEK